MFKRTKKGIIEVGFAWIFILIAGVVILGLFAYIGINQGNFFKNLINANLLTDLNAIFVGAQVSKNTAAVFEIPKTKLSFGCASYGIDGNAHPNQARLIFAPKEIKTNELITWSKPWSLGYRITNLLYITSPYIKYYIVYAPSKVAMADEIFEDLPRQLSKEKISSSGTQKIENQNYDRVHILVLGVATKENYETYKFNTAIYDENDFKGYEDDEIIFIYVFDDSMLTESTLKATITFKDRKQKSISFKEGYPGPYQQGLYDISALYAAYISGNQEIWQCTMVRAFFKAREVLQIYKERTVELDANPNNILCNYDYALNSGTGYFNKMEDHLDEPGTGNIIISHPTGDDLSGDILSFDTLNTQLERASCPLIY